MQTGSNNSENALYLNILAPGDSVSDEVDPEKLNANRSPLGRNYTLEATEGLAPAHCQKANSSIMWVALYKGYKSPIKVLVSQCK
jgi:hypothetical protein